MLWFVLAQVAFARDYTVPGDFETLEDAVEAMQAGDTIILLPGEAVVVEPIELINRGRINIVGTFPPIEVNDPDADINSYISPDWNEGQALTARGVFLVAGNTDLRLRNITMKAIEQGFLCDDDWDNDDNGAKNGEEPACNLMTPGVGADEDSADTAVPAGVYPRAIDVVDGGTLTITNSRFQGWGYLSRGSAVMADEGTVTITGSLFHSNFGLPLFTYDADVIAGYGGAVFVRAGSLTVTDTTFSFNHGWYGGAIYSANSVVEIDRSVFWLNEAFQGGGIFAEDRSNVVITRSHLFGNNANMIVSEDNHFQHRGGAAFIEDSSVLFTNNVFGGNTSLDYGGAIYVRQSQGGPIGGVPMAAPVLEFNTLHGNVGGELGGVVDIENVEILFNNNVAQFNTDVLFSHDWPVGTPPIVGYNDFWANLGTPGRGGAFGGVFGGDLVVFPVSPTTNIEADPLYRGAPEFVPEWDWRLFRFWPEPWSPVVDAADPAYSDVGGSRADMGAYGGPDADVLDRDGDTWADIYDCNDEDASVYPFAEDVCDDQDNNCDGVIDENEVTYWPDVDYDGHGDANSTPTSVCPGETLPTLPVGVWVTSSDDCDDNNPRVNPSTPEYCDTVDNDCDGRIDEDITPVFQYPDRDGDGFGNGDPSQAVVLACPPVGYSPFGGDCNDTDLSVHPLVEFIHRAHLPLANAPLESSEADRNRGYVADGIDQDCDGGDLCYADYDIDGFGGAPPAPGVPPAYVADNDLICDNNSNIQTSSNATDCSDQDIFAYPGAPEKPGDGVDQNCDGLDTCYEDLDDDGYGSAIVVPDSDLDCDNNSAQTASRAGDCVDIGQGAAAANPEAAETCDGVDNNCDGEIDEITAPGAKDYYQDADNDGYGNINVKVRACLAPDLYVERAGDCNDNDPRAYPQAPELCDGIDNNCDGVTDDASALDAEKWLEDVDGDGWGNPDLSERSCGEPSTSGTWVRSGRPVDCNDADPFTGPSPNGRCPDGSCSVVGSGDVGGAFVALLAMGALRRRRQRG